MTHRCRRICTRTLWRIPVLLVTASVALTDVASPQRLDNSAWTNYTNANEVMALAGNGDTLWLATTGGLVHMQGGDAVASTALTNADGLGDNDLRFVAVDTQGRVWCGGVAGKLSRRYTDSYWRVYAFDPDDPSLVLTSAVNDTNGFLWVGSSAGVHKFDIERHGGEIKENYARFGNPPISISVQDVMIADGFVWIAGDNGVARADVSDPNLNDPTHWQSWTGLPTLNTIAVFAGQVYLGGSDGVWGYTDTIQVPGDTLWERIGLEKRSIQDLYATSDTLWIASDEGLGFCTASACQTPTVPGTPKVLLTSLARTADGAIWSGRSNAGVERLKDGTSSSVTIPGPLSNDITGVAVGHDGRIWCIHQSAGADYLEDGQWYELEFFQNFRGQGGTSITVAPDGDVWLTTWGDGATRVNPDDPLNDWVNYDTANSSLMWVVDPGGPSDYIVVRDVAADAGGRVWFANAFADSGRRLPYFDPGQNCWGSFDIEDGFISDNLQTLATADNEVLIGFENAGIGSLEYDPPLCIGGTPADPPADLTYKDTDDGLPSDNVLAILIDRADSLWVGTNLGLAHWTPDFHRFRQIPLPSAAGLTVNALAVDALNTVWVGTERGLVQLPAAGDAEFYDKENSPLVGNRVRAIAVDDSSGAVWIATGNGLSRLDAGVTPAESIDDVRAFPNPFEVISGETARVRFDAPYGSRVFIYTASGQFIIEVDVTEGWDGRNSSGELVASGMYIFVVRGPDGDYGHGKLAVIQRR
jgi:ligand-binding sensor domain-containing protein